MKRILLLILALAMLIPSLVACGKKDDQSDGGSNTDLPDQNTAEEYYLNTLSKTYDADEILICTQADNTKGDTELTTESTLVDQAIFERHVLLEEKFDIEILFDTLPGDVSEDMTRMRTMATVDEGADFFIHQGKALMTLAIEGNIKKLNDVPTVNLAKDWWNQSMVENTTINNVTYIAGGPFTPWYYGAPIAIAFNKDLVTRYEIPDLYETVSSGNWTLEEMAKISKDYGIYNEEQEMYPIAVNTTNPTYSLFVSSGGKMTELSDDGVISVSHLGNEASRNILEDVLDACSPQTNYFQSVSNSAGKFIEGKAVLWVTSVGFIANRLRTSEIDYGIIPCPKLDSSQPEYISTGLANSSFCVGIPARLEGEYANWVGTFMEAYCFLGYDKIKPARYDTLLKYQVALDPSASEMMDIIFGNMYFDLNMFCDFGGSANLIANVCNGSVSLGMFTSLFTGLKPAMDAAIREYDVLVGRTS